MSEIVYESDGFRVVSDSHGVVMSNKSTGRITPVYGDDVATVLEGIRVHAATSAPVEEITDRYLSQFLTAVEHGEPAVYVPNDGSCDRLLAGHKHCVHGHTTDCPDMDNCTVR